MKTSPSHYILAAEVIIIILFHTVKIRQTEKHSVDIAFTRTPKITNLIKPEIENKKGLEYMLAKMIK
jgi:hypothetical protein